MKAFKSYNIIDRQGRRQGGAGGHAPPVVDWVNFLTEKNWLCWDAGPALFSKVTLLHSNSQKCSLGLKYVDPAAGAAPVLRATTFWEKMCTLATSVSPPPNVKSWPRACKQTNTARCDQMSSRLVYRWFVLGGAIWWMPTRLRPRVRLMWLLSAICVGSLCPC